MGVRARLEPPYWLLWTTAAVSNAGDGLRVAALPLLAATITTDPGRVAAVSAAIWLPWLLFGLHAGAFVDRLDRPRLIRNVQLGRLLVAAALAGLVLADSVPIVTVYTVAFAIGVGEVLTENALQSLVPRVVTSRAQLEAANSRLIAAETAGNELLGPPVGGLLFGVVPALPFLADAASYGCSAAAAELLRRRMPPERRSLASQRGMSGEIADGMRWLRRHEFLRALTFWGGVFNIGSTAAFSLLVLLALEELGLSAFGFGLLLSVSAVGGLAGTSVASLIARRVGPGRTILAGGAISGATVAVVGLLRDPWLVAVTLFINSFSGVLVNVVGRALRQAMVPNRLLGRVHSAGRVVVYAGMPMGAGLGGWIASTWSVRDAFVVGGILMITVSLAIAPWLRRHVIDAALAEGLRVDE